MGNKRIYEVAKDYGKPVNEVIDLLKKNNIEKTNFSAADDKAMSVIRKAYDKKPEPPKPAKTEKRDVSKPAAPARPQDTAKRNDNNMNRNNGQRNMQQNQQQNQRNNNNAQQGRNENRQGGRNEGRPQQNRGGQQGNRQGGRNEGRPQNRNGQQGGQGNRQGNRNGQQRQGGIFVGPKSQQGPSVHGESRAQVSGGRSEGRSSGRSEGGRDNRQGGRNAGKSRKDNKLQIKGSYATRESRPNRSAGHQMPINRGGKKPAPKQQQAPVEIVRPTYVEIGESINVQEFSKLIKREVNEVIKALFMLGVMVTINQDIDFDTAQLIGDNFGVEVGQKAPEEDPTEIPEVDDPPEKRVPRPPVITVMGHVDHGKTSLLDAIRKTNVTSREAGGITQHIGAYKVNYQGKQIVFLDTPGHEAFTAMRARGAQVTDVAILVVAADDGVMPQTIEAINHAKAAKVPIIVAINKIDRPGANPDHVKQQLAEHELIPEDWGGDTIMVPVSAHQKTGISDLLEMILLVAEMQELKANPNLPAHGTIIEAQLDKGRGPVATVLVQRGTLHIGDTIIAGTSYGKVRAMINDRGEKVKKALPSTPVEVLGLNDVPAAGDILDSTDEKTARGVAEKRIAKKKEEEIKLNSKVSLDDLFQRIKEGEIKELNIVVKADVQGTIEALKASLEKIKNDEVKVAVVHAGVGAITESDVMLASAANALIIGFNVRPDANARKAAETEKVDVRTYRVIYDALNDVEAAIKGMLAPKFKEVIQGRVEIRQLITISKLKIAGCYVVEGKVTNSSKVRVVRDGIVVHEGVIESLRRFKDDVKEVAQGFECGITLEKFSDLKEGDIFEVYDMEEIAVE
ncbi:translation initiation factor IF-2 [Phascolarctobacterium succinatutens]|jgi:translation initiation factor IF-2|uniref:translation initiation factor IF-2 n=1 Tax=Phascolarctobacterium succinatutens TaxID=626940 RepID=UPI001B427F3A|nr:translation initiation factor IF-2 [Phascolarctobacterium succinatutens]MBP7224184.1 translation initiation factor IF-2 [Phascolarctobacterium sp.]MEE0356372.1 translation initiation factor IF-2 [Phascolarctobacterium succinatutens]